MASAATPTDRPAAHTNEIDQVIIFIFIIIIAVGWLLFDSQYRLKSLSQRQHHHHSCKQEKSQLINLSRQNKHEVERK